MKSLETATIHQFRWNIQIASPFDRKEFLILAFIYPDKEKMRKQEKDKENL